MKTGFLLRGYFLSSLDYVRTKASYEAAAVNLGNQNTVREGLCVAGSRA